MKTTLLTLQLTAPQRRRVRQGKEAFYRREHTRAYVTKKKVALTQYHAPYMRRLWYKKRATAIAVTRL